MEKTRTGTPAADTEVTRARMPPTTTGMDLHEILSETIDWDGEAFSMDPLKPGYQRDTISSFTSRAIAKSMPRKKYDERHNEVLYAKCKIPIPAIYLDPDL